MSDLEASVKDAIENNPRTQRRNFGEMNVFNGEDDDLFVEVFYNTHSITGSSLVHYPRETGIALLDATPKEAKIHLTVTIKEKVVRLTLDPRFRDLSAEELRGKISQALRIS